MSELSRKLSSWSPKHTVQPPSLWFSLIDPGRSLAAGGLKAGRQGSLQSWPLPSEGCHSPAHLSSRTQEASSLNQAPCSGITYSTQDRAEWTAQPRGRTLDPTEPSLHMGGRPSDCPTDLQGPDCGSGPGMQLHGCTREQCPELGPGQAMCSPQCVTAGSLGGCSF